MRSGIEKSENYSHISDNLGKPHQKRNLGVLNGVNICRYKETSDYLKKRHQRGL